MFNCLFLIYIYDILIKYHIQIYAQLCIHISITKAAYNYEEELYYNKIMSASYGHVTFIASRYCQNLVGLDSYLQQSNVL